MIKITGVSKVYPGPTLALIDINLEVERGDFVFIVGPSGAGKSTLLRLLYREEVPTEGRVTVDGRDVGALRRKEIPFFRRHLGVIFQDFKLLPDRTVFENVAYALRIMEASHREIRRRVPATLDLVGLLDKAHSYPSQLSGGEQQRVAMARALVGRPSLVVADEPTGNLDPANAREVVRILHEVNHRGATVVMATHAKNLVDTFKRRVIAMEGGRIVRDDRLGGYGLEA